MSSTPESIVPVLGSSNVYLVRCTVCGAAKHQLCSYLPEGADTGVELHGEVHLARDARYMAMLTKQP